MADWRDDTWLIAGGRDRTPGEAAPAPFPRPTDVIEIEKKTVFDHWQGALDAEPKS